MVQAISSKSTRMRIVYSDKYNIGCFGIERLHPFDSRKYGRAWREIRRSLGRDVDRIRVAPTRAVSRADLLRVHSVEYIDRLRDSKYVAGALELPQVGWLPHWLVDWCVLRPMRWATAGTMLATRLAMKTGLAVNLGGGFHHAKRDRGEGFCIYGDIALAIDVARRESWLADDAAVAYIDLDAHQGNGISHIFMSDSRLRIFDMYNRDIYPRHDLAARQRIDCDLPVDRNTSEDEYLETLREFLPMFLQAIASQQPIGLAIYNAGTDVVKNDPLGGLNLSSQGVLDRDLFVIRQLRECGIPTVMVPSGGYTRESYRLMANSVMRLCQIHAFSS